MAMTPTPAKVLAADPNARLNQIYSTRADKVLFVQGDPGLSFASIADVLDISHAAGVDHVAIVTRAALR